MKKAFLSFLLATVASCLSAQDLKTPEYFIDQIPHYPTTPEVYQQKIDSVQLVEQEIEDARAAYQQAEDEAVSKLDPATVAKAYTQSMNITQEKGVQQQAQQSLADMDTTKGGYAYIMYTLTKNFTAAQDQYNAEMKRTIYPIDSSLIAMMGEQDKAGEQKIKQLALKRKNEYNTIMEKYLLGAKPIFEDLLKTYRDYMLSESIPRFDRQERDQTRILNLTFIPHTVALKEIQTYLYKYEEVLKNFKDYKD
jgi:hypothetical protein